MINTVADIIKEFGGLQAMTRALGHRHPTTIQAWRDRGVIPNWRQHEILEAAKRKGVDVGPDDLASLVKVA